MRIFINNLNKITDVKYSIGYTHFYPLDTEKGLGETQEQLEKEGKLIDYTGDANGTLYYNPVTNTCFSE